MPQALCEMNPILGIRGAVVAPNSLAAQAGLEILREGGNAIEAAIATASTLAVVYPHMTGIGGDGFWLLHQPNGQLRGLDACGAAGRRVLPDLYEGLNAIPWRGPLAANTVAGTVSGWGLAYDYGRRNWSGRLPWSRLLETAQYFAREGFPVTHSQAANTRASQVELQSQPGFACVFMPEDLIPSYGQRHRLPALAATLEQLAREGADAFYRGDLAGKIAADLSHVGSPLVAADLAAHQAQFVRPLELRLSDATVFNLPAPTQGLASLAILGIYGRLRQPGWSPETVEGIHALVEATKQAFCLRDRYIADPRATDVDLQSLLSDSILDAMTSAISLSHASPWLTPASDGDTTWLGVIDREGRAVSVIQSIYFQFGSGVVLPETGITWQNRGCAFCLQPGQLRSLVPGRKPFHTLNPALAQLDDGRLLLYGTMGGEGQPQTQAAVFCRYVWGDWNARSAVAAPRWLLGRTSGEISTTLKLEARYSRPVADGLRALGHAVEVVQEYDERMGHAGALVFHPGGWIEGGEDPRSDGCVAAW
jgi:gamma-glutamyltranspeptidase